MGFDVLLNKPLSEPQLLDILVAETQKNYLDHQNTYYFFKLKNDGEKTSEIIWIKSCDNPEDFADFYYDTKVLRASIMLKFCKGRYEVLCQGYFYSDHFEIWPDKILNSRPMERRRPKPDDIPAPPRELVEGAFGEITQALASSKSNIPM